MNKTIENLIIDYVNLYPENMDTLTHWQEPLVAVADPKDSGFLKLKEIVGPSHLLPHDLLANAASVICYFLPFAREVGLSNGAGQYCSDSWAYAYLESNQLIHNLSHFLRHELGRLGHQTAIIPATHNFDESTLRSDWSHRHVAVIAGLGTLGLNRMLITSKGCCGRLGSLICDLPLKTTPRPSRSACLYSFNQSCYRCIKNCAGEALQEINFNPHKCYDLLLKNAEFHIEKGLVDACGKCLCHIPCSFTDPVDKLVKRKNP